MASAPKVRDARPPPAGGGGRAFRSTLPLPVIGNRGTAANRAGTMYLGLVVVAVLRSSGWRAAFRILAALTAVPIGGAALVLRVPGGASVWSDLSCRPSGRRRAGK